MHCAKLKLSQKAFEDTLFPQFLVVFLTRALLQLKEAVEGRNKKKFQKIFDAYFTQSLTLDVSPFTFAASFSIWKKLKVALKIHGAILFDVEPTSQVGEEV